MSREVEQLSASRRGMRLLERVDYRVAETPEEKDAVYALRYRGYRHAVMIPSSESQRVIDEYDDAPNAWTFGVYVDGELCGSVRLNVLTSDWRMGFTTALFGDILHPRLDRGEVFIEPSRFVADPDKIGRFPELPFVTLRLGYLACEFFGADCAVALARSDHQAFYRRVFLYESIADARAFPNALVSVFLMASPFKQVGERVVTRFPILRSNAFERRMLFDRGASRTTDGHALPRAAAELAEALAG